MHDEDVSAHRTRSNVRPQAGTVHAPEALTQAVNEVYEALEDRG